MKLTMNTMLLCAACLMLTASECDNGETQDPDAGGMADAGGDSGQDTDDAGADAAADAAEDAAADAGGLECFPLSTVLESYSVENDAEIPAGCYIVEEMIIVWYDAVLTIKPGVTLEFMEEAGIDVESDGALSAAGTKEDPIIMTGVEKTPGYWQGVYFLNTDSDRNVLEHVTVEYAGAQEMLDDAAGEFSANVMLDSSGYEVRVSITGCVFRHGSGYGFYFDHTAVVPGFSDCVITKNAAGAGFVYAASAHNLSGASTYTGNDSDFVLVNADYDFGDEDRTWPALDVPYRMHGNLLLYNHLTLSAGTTLLFTAESGIEVLDDYAGITAIGTEDDPIVFSGTEETAGHWDGLYFSNTNDDDAADPRSRFEHVTVEYGGAYAFNDSQANEVRGCVMLDSSGWGVAVSFNNSTIRHSSGWGVWLDCLGTFNGSGNDFSDNAWGDQGREDNCK